jgi:exoribonuclease-2
MSNVDLTAAAREEMIKRGFTPDIPADALQQAQTISPHPDGRDLTSIAFSSIDNDESRDLDQVEWVERVPDGIRVLVGIADVSAAVPKDSPIDAYAAHETTTVYAGVRTFPMLPEKLSTDLTSLSEGEDRAAVVIEFVFGADGCIARYSVYPARLRNRARLTYNAVGSWLEGKGEIHAAPEIQ